MTSLDVRKIEELAAAIDLHIPSDCIEGVAANLSVLREHWEILAAASSYEDPTQAPLQ